MSCPKADIVIENISQLLDCKEDRPDLVGVRENQWIAIEDDKIIAVGEKNDVTNKVDISQAIQINGKGKVVLPSFVDAHTHLVFGGDRREEYTANLTESGKKDLKQKGIKTGLYASVDMTRETSEDQLYEESKDKIQRMLESGTTTVEIKSGYGLDYETEMKQLNVIKKLDQQTPMDVHATFLGAHGWPQDMEKQKYVDYLIGEIIPRVGEEGIATACDIWVDEGFF